MAADRYSTLNHLLTGSVPDPWHFGVDPDLRIYASDGKKSKRSRKTVGIKGFRTIFA
jgi:hypothetical protein